MIGKILRKCAAIAVDLADRLVGYAPAVLGAEDAVVQGDVLIRWGDGESSLAIGKSTSFQTRSHALARELRALLRGRDPRVTLCLPGALLKSSPFRTSDDKFRRIWVLSALLMRLWARRGPYGDSFMFRREGGMGALHALSALLSKAGHVILVSSDPNHADWLRDLGYKARVQQLLVPRRNAYSRRNEIKRAILALGKPDVLLLSAGPTGKCLAPELMSEWRDRVKIIDTGHLFDQLLETGSSKWF